jgi:cyclopropane fatty-acyl-phospholipid synthase-like methyltransferase
MKHSKSDLSRLLTVPEYPRSAQYDPEWVLDNLMGPNVLWLTEALTQVMELKPGMRVLDLGCGKAVSSIFLAKEFDLQVWATDLWIKPEDNWTRIEAAGVSGQVFPIYAEAHTLPFAHNFFDALVSMDAYHYFGTNDLYLAYCSRFIKPGGQIGIVVPGLLNEFNEGLPDHLAPYWLPEFWSFHSPDWWKRHWQRSGAVKVTSADTISDGWKLWLMWLDLCAEQGYPSGPQEAEMLRLDAGQNLGFTRIVAQEQ